MTTKKATVVIDLEKADIDELVKQEIRDLKKQVGSLERKLKTRDNKIKDLNEYINFSKEIRVEVMTLCKNLIDLLEDKRWIEIDRYECW